MPKKTLADEAEAWARERGIPIPPRDTDARQALYEEWAAYAFEHFPNDAVR